MPCIGTLGSAAGAVAAAAELAVPRFIVPLLNGIYLGSSWTTGRLRVAAAHSSTYSLMAMIIWGLVKRCSPW